MKILVIIHNLACLCGVIFTQNDVRQPPSITLSPKKSEIFRDGNKVELGCKAEGIPAVTYAWKKNGVDLNLNLPNITIGPDGNLTINPAKRMDEGFYQCFASNRFGTALSNTSHIQEAFLDSSQSFPDSITVQEGRPFVIPAARRKSFPEAIYNWETASNPVDPAPKQLHPSQRMQIACNGDLYFAYAEKQDEHGGKFYKSTVYNPKLDVKSGGSYTRVTVTEVSKPLPEFAPNITYSSVSQNISLIGGSVILKCFFSGNPLPTIQWTRLRGSLFRERSVISNFGTLLTISNIVAADEGDYVCTGGNTNGNAQHTLRIRVEAEPKFTQESDGPRNVKVTEGESVTFNCRASAKPEADVVWRRNGQPIDVNNVPVRFAFSDDKKSLTIRDVCRDCPDRERPSDLTVIQCNASNVHGYAFASGYLNVLRRTQLVNLTSTFIPVDLTKENHFQFDCSATSDPLTPPTVNWYKLGPKGREAVHNVTNYVSLVNAILTINTEPNCSATCLKSLGEYRCVASNGYSQANASVTLNATEPTETRQETSFQWLLVLIAIIGLLIATIGVILGWCGKRCNADRNRTSIAKDAEIPHPNSIYEDIGYDSIDVLPEEVTKLENQMCRADSMYEHVGYDSIELPLEKARTTAEINQSFEKSNEVNPYTDLAREIAPPPVYMPLRADDYLVLEN